jgi:arylsulfatase
MKAHRLHARLSWLALTAAVVAAAPTAAGQAVIGRTIDTSVEGPVVRPAARQGAPNILVWVIDDTGFGQL